MTRQALDDFVASARAGKTEAPRRVNAMWAGIEAVKVGEIDPCPFDEGEADLVAGFRRGVEIALQNREAAPPVFDRTLCHNRSESSRASHNTFAAQSSPREED